MSTQSSKFEPIPSPCFACGRAGPLPSKTKIYAMNNVSSPQVKVSATAVRDQVEVKVSRMEQGKKVTTTIAMGKESEATATTTSKRKAGGVSLSLFHQTPAS